MKKIQTVNKDRLLLFVLQPCLIVSLGTPTTSHPAPHHWADNDMGTDGAT